MEPHDGQLLWDRDSSLVCGGQCTDGRGEAPHDNGRRPGVQLEQGCHRVLAALFLVWGNRDVVGTRAQPSGAHAGAEACEAPSCCIGVAWSRDACDAAMAWRPAVL